MSMGQNDAPWRWIRWRLLLLALLLVLGFGLIVKRSYRLQAVDGPGAEDCGLKRRWFWRNWHSA